jgi:hypothetical protein
MGPFEPQGAKEGDLVDALSKVAGFYLHYADEKASVNQQHGKTIPLHYASTSQTTRRACRDGWRHTGGYGSESGARGCLSSLFTPHSAICRGC